MIGPGSDAGVFPDGTAGANPERCPRCGRRALIPWTLRRDDATKHPIEQVGKQLRGMMPWIAAGKQRVQDVSGG